MANTPKLVLPVIASSQAQKHVVHNSSLRILDAVVQLSVKDRITTPPGVPVNGDRYLVTSVATGAWLGEENHIAAYQDGAWYFYTPNEGWTTWVDDENTTYVWDGAAWVAYATSLMATPLSDGTFLLLGINGATADTTNRFNINSPAALFNRAVDDITVKLNKAAAADDAVFSFQNSFSVRALMGNIGDDDFTVRVSPDGTTFYTGLSIDKDTGNVGIGTAGNASNKLTVSGSSALLYNGSGSFSFVFSKNAAADDASMSFQTNFSTRALAGLLADDNWTVKVSPDGSTFKTAMVVDKSTAAVAFSEHPKFSAYLNFGQDYTAGAWQDLLFNNFRHNDQSDAATAANVLTFTAPHAGYYMFGIGATYEAGLAPTKMQVGLSVAGATPTSDTIGTAGDATFVSGETSAQATALLKLTAGQTVKPKIFFTTNNGRVLADENYFWGAQVP